MIPYAALFTFPRGVRYYYEIIHVFIYLSFSAWICEGKLDEQNISTQQKEWEYRIMMSISVAGIEKYR